MDLYHLLVALHIAAGSAALITYWAAAAARKASARPTSGRCSW